MPQNNLLYQPSNPSISPTLRFLESVNHNYSTNLRDYHDLYTWSTHNIDKFWYLVWKHTGVIGHRGDHVVDNSALPSSNPPWLVSLSTLTQAWRLLMHVSGSAMRGLTGQRTCYTAVQPRPPLFKRVSRCWVLHPAVALSDLILGMLS